ncbi:transient receptor potential cation channel subfamily M member-like 2 [Amphiura filiformis]|uniref:transient receptor potential cation channel subfamily M member-like 2 n=1 Tax=Amphiura filiformis TaxID=82378 RepID=UPI003B2210E4
MTKVVRISIDTTQFKQCISDTKEDKKAKDERKNKLLKEKGEQLLEKLEAKWNWVEGNRPNLIISVTGGAWDFPLNNNTKEVFRKGIIEAAESANAWVITGGTNVGVMKYVGTAVGDYEMAKRNGAKKIKTIGIAVWGKLRSDYRTAITDVLREDDVVTLDPGPTDENDVSSLEPNHSYFILVDDGTNNYGSDVPVRGGLEKAMSDNWTLSGLKETIPVVCIVVEGGPNTIKQAKEAVSNEIPIVIVANSGRASNVMAAAFDRPDLSETRQHIWKKNVEYSLETIIEHVKDRPERHTDLKDRCLEDIEAMVDFKREKFLNVYAETSKTRIDQMILKALIKAKKKRRLVQLRLAQTWNRRDIVEYNEILGQVTDTTDWKNYENDVKGYEQNLHTALVNDQVEFVQMFLENNIVKLETYLTKEELANLYKETNVRTDKCDQKTQMIIPPLLQGTHWDDRKNIDDDDDDDNDNSDDDDDDCHDKDVVEADNRNGEDDDDDDNGKNGDDDDDCSDKVLRRIEEFLQELVAPAFKLIADKKSEEKDKKDKLKKPEEKDTATVPAADKKSEEDKKEKLKKPEDIISDPHRQLFSLCHVKQVLQDGGVFLGTRPRAYCRSTSS